MAIQRERVPEANPGASLPKCVKQHFEKKVSGLGPRRIDHITLIFSRHASSRFQQDFTLEKERVLNLTERVDECKDDIQLLLSNGNDPTKIRQSLLSLQQKMRSKTKEHAAVVNFCEKCQKYSREISFR